MFQFHIGSIKSCGVNYMDTARAYVSIPHWFD